MFHINLINVTLTCLIYSFLLYILYLLIYNINYHNYFNFQYKFNSKLIEY